ncbi:GFA family protein [Rhizobium leguminosarum]|uniref:GFA family protein n=2 Tax=Rhizobium leguminosarum TaxID=384 RepID=UPI0013BEDE0E|nr:GFA family protein [Rhizobium leguminosarum]MBY5422261.1 GFA family protein [Rhizobium leguminosarum]NEJ47254.1 aldehyde-activating protein [Rhizobium leguminosarum]NEJ50074.1 aldehyde-activating protein [Rhizobium leguminosarum]
MRRLATCCCGELTATANGSPVMVALCHCRSCQRRTGSAFGVAVLFNSENVRCAGEARAYTRNGDSGHNVTFEFCPSCGTTVYWMPNAYPGLTAIGLGCFEDPSGFEPEKVVYGHLRHPWVNLWTG